MHALALLRIPQQLFLRVSLTFPAYSRFYAYCGWKTTWRGAITLSVMVQLDHLPYVTLGLVLSLASATERPIIGVLTQEGWPLGQGSKIVGSYIKAVEQCGARVAPIFINRTVQYYRDILGAVNGVLLPGGGANFTNVGGYGDAGRIILNYTKQANSAGDYFPVLGVCLGMEMLFYWEVGGSYEILDTCDAPDDALPLVFKKGFRRSRLFRKATKCTIETLSRSNVTYNHHKRCVTEELLSKYGLNKSWRVLSTNVDRQGKQFVSSIESRQFPLVGIQFHPEKNAFEWNTSEQLPHSTAAIRSARYFYDWFVDEARKNQHSFANPSVEHSALIYNYNASYVGQGGSNYELIYYFT